MIEILFLMIGFILGFMFTNWSLKDNINFKLKYRPEATKEDIVEWLNEA